jgi:hypothetical protein
MKYLCTRTCFISAFAQYCIEGQFYEFDKKPGKYFKKVGPEEAEEKSGKRTFRKTKALSELAPKAGKDTHEYVEPEKK